MITGTVIVKLELSSQLGDKTTDYRVELNSKLWLLALVGSEEHENF